MGVFQKVRNQVQIHIENTRKSSCLEMWGAPQLLAIPNDVSIMPWGALCPYEYADGGIEKRV